MKNIKPFPRQCMINRVPEVEGECKQEKSQLLKNKKICQNLQLQCFCLENLQKRRFCREKQTCALLKPANFCHPDRRHSGISISDLSVVVVDRVPASQVLRLTCSSKSKWVGEPD